MNQFVRFWVLTLSLAIAVCAFAYLFLSFIFPNPTLVQTQTEMRLLATLVSIVSGGIFIWSMLFISPDDSTQIVTE